MTTRTTVPLLLRLHSCADVLVGPFVARAALVLAAGVVRWALPLLGVSLLAFLLPDVLLGTRAVSRPR